MGWVGIITFMFLYTHRHSKLIIFLAVLQTQALLFHDQGWDNNVHVPPHTPTNENDENDDDDDDDDDGKEEEGGGWG